MDGRRMCVWMMDGWMNAYEVGWEDMWVSYGRKDGRMDGLWMDGGVMCMWMMDRCVNELEVGWEDV